MVSNNGADFATPVVKVRVGLIGVGNIGYVHLNQIMQGRVAGMVMVACCDIDVNKQEQIQKAFPNLDIYADYHDLLRRDDVDAVIIAVPHPLHGQIAIDSFHAGKHVLVEKPVSVTVSVAKNMNKAAEESGKTFCIMFNQRTNPLFAKAREIVQSGQLGELKRSVWIITNWYRTQFYYDSGNWRATWVGEGGGVLLNQAPHNLDLWQWICGMPEEIVGYCDIGKYHDIEVEDDVTIFARYSNGAVGTFISSTGEYPGTNRLEISGSLGKLVVEDGVLKWWKLQESERDFCKTANKSFAEIPTEYLEFKQEDTGSPHLGILRNFTNAIICDEPLLSPGSDGVFELSISNAAYLSSWKGNVPIRMPFDEKEFDLLLSEKQNTSSLKNSAKTGGKGITEYAQRWKSNW